ncbi:hypothetical protein C0J52_13720 [Blattella germanica]|nr:hypothetical protein C0J52_13720 [Blattella germanica]
MGRLKCPLCCDDEFLDQLSLKYHLLSLIDNIHCPECNERFDNILELTKHLNGYCGYEVEDENGEISNVNDEENSVTSTENVSTNAVSDENANPVSDENDSMNPSDETVLNEMNSTEQELHITVDPAMSVQGDVIEGDAASSVADSDGSSIQVIEANGKRIRVQVPKKIYTKEPSVKIIAEEETEEPIEYSCSTCNVTFTSVADHIREYHEGEDVAVKVSDENKDDVYNLVKLEDIGTVVEGEEETSETNKSQQTSSYGQSNVKRKNFRGDTREFLKWKKKVKDLSKKDKIKEMAKRFKWITKEMEVDSLEVISSKKIKNEMEGTNLTNKFGEQSSLKIERSTQRLFDPSDESYQEIIIESDSKFNLKEDNLPDRERSEISVFTCTSCHEEFGNMSMFKKHCFKSETCSGTRNVKTKCLQMVTIPAPKMDAKRESKSGLQLVYKAVKCEFCDKVFTKLGAFRLHMKSHKNFVKNIFTCVLCQSVFNNSAAYQKHVKMHLETDKFDSEGNIITT